MAKDKDLKTPNVPPLRFPGFTDEWKQYTIDDIAKIEKGSGISKDQLSEDGEECILYGELYTKYKSEIINEIYSKTNINSSKLTRSQKNDVIIPCSGESAEDIATSRCVSKDGILMGGDLNIIRFKDQDGAFMSYQLNGKRKYDIARVAQGVSVAHLYPDHLKSVKVNVPQIEEQRKIVRLLSLIDERIATQNKIIEDLKKLKSAIRWKIFSDLKNHQTKTIEVGELLAYEQPSPYIVTNDEYVSDSNKIPVLTANKGFILGYTDEPFGIYQKGNCIIFDDFTMDAKYVTFPFKVKSSAIKILTAKPSANLRFMFEYLQSLDLKSEEHKRHYISEVAKMVVSMPSIDMQKNIASILVSIDTKLMIERNLTNRYEEEKQYLLSNMFI